MTAKANLRRSGTPTRVSELFLPTILCLLSRRPQSAPSLLRPPPETGERAAPGTRVTALHDRPAHLPARTSAGQVNR